MCNRSSRDTGLAKRCPRTGRRKWPWAALLFPLVGVLSLVWFLVRVIPKPSRASYPCMRVAAPLASGFVMWLLGMGGAVVALRKARQRLRQSRYELAAACVVVALVAAWIGALGPRLPLAVARARRAIFGVTTDPPNDPIGVATGCNPGRVVWVHDPDATDESWDFVDEDSPPHWFEPDHTEQTVIDTMVYDGIRWLAGKQTPQEAWHALFRYFNQDRGKGSIGYQAGERVAIKVNFVTCSTGRVDQATGTKTHRLNNTDVTPQLLLALVRHLVNVVGMADTDISVGDPTRCFPKQWHDMIVAEFPGVTFVDHWGDIPYTALVSYSSTEFHWSTPDAAGTALDYLPVCFAEADYLINLTVLKGHAAGVTLCGKNHYGSLIRGPNGLEWGVWRTDLYNMHDSLPTIDLWYPGGSTPGDPGRGKYRCLVDMMGHEELGAKTVLYVIDGLYGGYYSNAEPFKWNMAPFGGDWPSSILFSQDPVAIDSVGYDFLSEEWPDIVSGGYWEPGDLEGGAEDYLHEAALAHDPPSGTFYDPEDDGVRMRSLGVHEHWNNADSKLYTRNLDPPGDGIELISSQPPASLDLTVESTPITGVPITGTHPDTSLYTALAIEGSSISLTAPKLVSDGGTDYGFIRWTLNGTDHPEGQGTLAFSMGEDYTATATYAPAETFDVDLAQGWNLVSIPLVPLDTARDAVFPPESCSAVWEFGNPGGYILPSEIVPRKGYWVKGRAPAGVTLTVTGGRPADKSVALRQGWNLVGVVGQSAAVPSQPLPPAPPRSAIWQYDNPGGYVAPATQCDDGKGFWIKASEDGLIWGD